MHQLVDTSVARRRGQVRRRHRADLLAGHKIEMTAAEFACRAAGENKEVPRLTQGGADGTVGLRQMGQGSDDQSRRDGAAFAVRGRVFVVQRVLAGDEGRTVVPRRIAATAHRGDKVAEGFRSARIAPGKVVEQCGLRGVGTGGRDVAHGFVDHRVGHALGIVESVACVHPDAESETGGSLRRGDHRAVRGT